jgi:photosynthetic reaction center cytochrome c subunit
MSAATTSSNSSATRATRWGSLMLLALLTLLAGCERPFMDSVQHGYRGSGMLQVYNPRTLAARQDNNTVPVSLPEASADGPKASMVFQNVKVLGDLSVPQFTRLMASITAWVSPKEGCVYCHDAANFADEGKYTKVVSRRMLEMTRSINSQWKTHVAETGVTCFTCHRGNAIPQQVWFRSSEQPYGSNFIGDKAGQNSPEPVVDLTSLPNDPFTPFLLGSQDIRVSGTTALPNGNRRSIKQAEWTYGLMTHASLALGVNCTYCHNTRSFQSWQDNPPQRAIAWYGIRMARALNKDFLEPLADTFPPYRKGALGDVAKANCATCHQGDYKPLNGSLMARDFPELRLPADAAAAVALK